MKQHVETSRVFTGPWWVVVSLLRIEGEELVLPVLEELHADLTAATSLSRRADVECGPLERHAGVATMSVHWRDASHADAFPEMDGQLLLVEHAPNSTELQFAGEYEPPLGVAGAVGDRLAGHRIAQHTVDDAIERLARRIEAAVSEQIGTA
jgi:hypothetical protein